MGLRFRWRAKIVPGVRLNLSLRGASLSLGGAPLTMNLGTHGYQTTLSAPGTGLSYVSRRRPASARRIMFFFGVLAATIGMLVLILLGAH